MWNIYTFIHKHINIYVDILTQGDEEKKSECVL